MNTSPHDFETQAQQVAERFFPDCRKESEIAGHSTALVLCAFAAGLIWGTVLGVCLF